MKKKIGLFIVSMLLSNIIEAGPIQERLEAALKETSKQIKDIPEVKDLSFTEWENLSDSGRKKWTKQLEQSETQKAHLSMRAELLEKVLFCLKQEIRTKESIKVSNKKESAIANKCFNQLVVQYQNTFEHYKDLRQILNQELERIRKKDLRQSWFWWF